MPIHFIPVGIEADTKQEAEQKILQIQQIATEYIVEQKANKSDQQVGMPYLYNELFGAVALIGLSWMEDYLQKRKADENRVDWKKEKYRLDRQRKKQSDSRRVNKNANGNEQKNIVNF